MGVLAGIVMLFFLSAWFGTLSDGSIRTPAKSLWWSVMAVCLVAMPIWITWLVGSHWGWV